MLNPLQRKQLIENWGEKAESLDCKAFVRFFDKQSHWQCYVFALNPENFDEILCIIQAGKRGEATVTDWSLKEISLAYNSEGEAPRIDKEYRPIYVQELLKKLRKE